MKLRKVRFQTTSGQGCFLTCRTPLAWRMELSVRAASMIACEKFLQTITTQHSKPRAVFRSCEQGRGRPVGLGVGQ